MPDAKLLLGDSLKLMKGIADKSIDAILTDPPYGVDYRGNAWDSEIPDWIGDARRIAKLVAFTTAPNTQWAYPLPDLVCCWHRVAAASRAPGGGFNHWTPILVYGTDVKFAVDTYETYFGRTVHENMGIEHPCPKPVELYVWMVLQTTSPGDTVLDPFMGSGTTGVACMRTGRNFIGIEIDSGYFAVAEERVKFAQAQISMPLLVEGENL